MAMQEINENKLGRCYELAGLFVVKHPDWKLVHGRADYLGTGFHFDHAWCELADLVFDPVLGWQTNRAIYYALFDAMAIKRYTAQGVAQKALESGYWEWWT